MEVVQGYVARKVAEAGDNLKLPNANYQKRHLEGGNGV